MNLFELFVKIGVKDEASKNIEGISSKLGKGLKTSAKIGTAAIGAAAGAIVTLTKQAVESYAEYEQLIGGANLMFGDAFGYVQQKSQEAYKNVQMSQNEYLQQVNGFATGLKTALGGNEQAAAELADKIITAEADIVAATGNTQENVQNAFNGIMKSNFTMLDNLQLGITPTKEGFQEVIDKVNKWNATNGEATKYQMGNLADMQSALVDYIDMVGMSGYAHDEAQNTISGSIATTKAAWSNLVTGVADDNADFEQLIDNFVESAGNTIEQILPRIEKSLDGAADLVDEVFPIIIDKIPDIITKFLPKLAKSAVNIIETLVNSLSENSDELTEVALEVIITLAEGLVKFLPQLIEKAPDIIFGIVNTLIDYLPEIISVGGDIVEGVWEGIKAAAGKFTENVKEFFKGVVDSAKEVLGIHSPSTVFRDTVGKNIVLGITEGINKNHTKVFTSLDKVLTNSKNKLLKTTNYEKTGELVVSQIESGINKSESSIENTANKLSSLIVKTMASSKNKSGWSETAKNLSKTFSESLIKNLDSLKKEAEEKISEIAKESQEKMDSVLKLRETLQNKLSNFGGLFIEDKDTGEITLTNLKKQTKQIKSYGKKLEKLSEYFSEDLMSAVVGMNMEDSKKFVDYVSTLSEKELKEYDKLYTKKMKAAKKVAKTYYAPYISEVKTEYTDKIQELFNSLNTSLDEAGKNAIKGFLKGFTSKNKSAKKEVNDFINGLVASVKKQLGIKSPSRVFMDIANQMVNGLIYGWDKAIGTFDDDVTNSLNFDSGYIGTFGGSYDNSYLGSGSVGRPINITQNIYAQKKSAAQLMQEARWQAQMGVLANA